MNRVILWNHLFLRLFIKRLLPFSLASLFMAFAFSLVSTSSTHATSVYDGSIRATSTISVISPDGTQNINISQTEDNDWYDIFSTSCGELQTAMLDDALTVGSVVISQQRDSSQDATYVSIAYQTTPVTVNATQFQTYGDESYFWLPSSGWQKAYISLLDNGLFSGSCNGWYTNAFSTSSALDGYYDSYIYYSTASITYPDGYEGIQAPSNATPPPSDEQPNLNLISATGYNLIIQDTNFNTFDEVPFVCDPVNQFPPQLNYELWLGDNPETDTLVTSGSQSSTLQFTYSLSPEAATYNFVAWYSCTLGDMTFDQVSFLPFEINAFGGLVTGCGEDIAGVLCSMGSNFSFGIFSTTFNGLVGVITSMQQISPTYCNTNWVEQANFQDDYIGVQNFPQEVCNNVTTLYLAPDTPFKPFTTWLNIILQGTAVLLLVFGLLALFGFRVRLPSPIGEEQGNDIRPDIATSSSISRHRASYVSGKSNTRNRGN